MNIDISQRQQKQVAKIARLREYFGGEDLPEIYEWDVEDEKREWQLMTKQEIEGYLKAKQ